MKPIESEKLETGIAGSYLQPLAIIPTSSGPVLHMLRQGYALMPAFPTGFGEIYFSEIEPNCVKAWKLHKKQAQLFAAPYGEIRIAMYDARPESRTKNELVVLRLGRPDNYKLLSIPPGIWYGFQCLSPMAALICNCANLPHEPEEAERLDMETDLIPFKWNQTL